MPLPEDIDNLLDPILAAFHRQIRLTVGSHLVRAYLQGDAQMVSYGTTKLGLAIKFEGPPIQKAIDWATSHSAKLITRMDDETKTRLAQTISDGIQNKRGIDGLARDIRNTFDDMSKYRSKLIAQTETNTALSTASYDRMNGMGVTGKQWVTVGDADVRPAHQENEAAGVIPINQPFPDGSMFCPGVDPFNCRCTLAPAMLEEQ